MAAIQTKLQNTNVTVKVLLGRNTITVKDLLELSVGDVIPLKRGINEELEVVIGQSTKFLGKPGILSNRLSLQISQVIKEGKHDE